MKAGIVPKSRPSKILLRGMVGHGKIDHAMLVGDVRVAV